MNNFDLDLTDILITGNIGDDICDLHPHFATQGLGKQRLEELFEKNIILERICKFYPNRLTRNIPEVHNISTGEIEPRVNSEFQSLIIHSGIQKRITDAFIKANIYGSYLLIFDDSDDDKYFYPYPFELTQRELSRFSGDDEVTNYRIGDVEIEVSDVVRLDASFCLKPNMRATSLIEKCLPSYINFIKALRAFDKICISLSTPVVKLKSLASKLAKFKETREFIQRRIMLINDSLLNMSPIAIDLENESLEYLERNLTGVISLFEISVTSLVAFSQIPEQYLLGTRVHSSNTSDMGLADRVLIGSQTEMYHSDLKSIYWRLIRRLTDNYSDLTLSFPEVIELTPIELVELNERKARAKKLEQEALTIEYSREYAKKYHQPVKGGGISKERRDLVGTELDNERNLV